MAYENLELLIGGSWTQGTSGKLEPVIDPATEEVLGQLPLASSDDLEFALRESVGGFMTWRSTTTEKRQQILEQAARLMEERRDTIAETLTREMGKPLAEAKGELDFTISVLRWYGEEGKRAYGRIVSPRVPRMRQMVLKEPVGPVAAFVAWNFPALNVMRKVAGALAAGCSIIIKASEETPGTCVAIARCLVDAGLPSGVLSVVFGVPDEVSAHLLGSPIPRKLSFTGSIPIGKHLQILAAESMKRCTLELGGHAPAIVFCDADIEASAKLLAAGKFRNAGQVCVSPSRIYVDEKVIDQFIEVFVDAVSDIKVGNGLDSGVTMGPLVGHRRLAVMGEFVADALDHGAELLAGGECIGQQGYFYAPTVLKHVPEESRIMNEEPFGPVVPICGFREFDEVIDRANRLQFGLAAYAFTTNGAQAMRIAERVEAGMVAINSLTVATPETPAGGVKESGYGSEGGIEGLEAYLQTKFVTEIGV